MKKHWLLLNATQFPSTTFPATCFWVVSDQLVFSVANYKVSRWECQKQVLSLCLKASKQVLFSKHLTARREKGSRDTTALFNHASSSSKNLRSRSISLPQINCLTPFILWFHEHLVPGSKGREGLSVPLLATLSARSGLNGS